MYTNLNDFLQFASNSETVPWCHWILIEPPRKCVHYTPPRVLLRLVRVTSYWQSRAHRRGLRCNLNTWAALGSCCWAAMGSVTDGDIRINDVICWQVCVCVWRIIRLFRNMVIEKHWKRTLTWKCWRCPSTDLNVKGVRCDDFRSKLSEVQWCSDVVITCSVNCQILEICHNLPSLSSFYCTDFRTV